MPLAHPSSLHQAEALADRFPPLLVAAERVASTVSLGVHGRRRSGTGETFWQYRHYVDGDPSGGIDWRRSATGDSLFIRETEWEAAQAVWLWADSSPSMNYRSQRSLPTKRDQSALLIAALACLLIRGGEKITNLAAGEPPRSGRIALLRLVHDLETGNGANGTIPVHPDVNRHGTVVLASDFLQPLETISTTVRAYARNGIRGHILQVLDPAEEHFPFSGRIRFEAMDGNGSVLVGRAEDIRKDYRKRLSRHRLGLEALARSVGWTFLSHRTDKPPHTCLLGLVSRMAR